MMDGNNKRGHSCKEWVDGVREWCGASHREVIHSALVQSNWQKMGSRHQTPTGIGPMSNDDDDDD